MDEFRLSIKNSQRKIGDVRDLFSNLTNNEKLALEKEKISIEQKQNIITQNSYPMINNKMDTKEVHQSEHELKVKNVYDRLAREANDDFGKYLDDDDDGYYEDEDESVKNNNTTNTTTGTTTTANNKNNNKTEKKVFKDIESSSNGNVKSKNKVETKKPKTDHVEMRRTDMCGLYELEPSPIVKQQHEKSNQPGIFGFKDRIKNFFSSKDEPANYVDIEQPPDQYYYPRTIQAVQYGSSKIGFQAGQTYQQYYTNVQELRDFDTEARVNNFKYNPTNNIAVMDDELNLHYTKTHPKLVKTKDESNLNNNKKSKSLNSKFAALFSKSKNKEIN